MQLEEKLNYSEKCLASVTEERDHATLQCHQLERKCEKLTSALTVHEAEVSSLRKELKFLRSEKENRKHFESRRTKEMLSIKGRAAKRSSVSLSSPVSEVSTVGSILDSVLLPMSTSQPEGLRKRVLSFSSGIDDVLTSTELQRLRIENQQYQARIWQLEEKIAYLKEEVQSEDKEGVKFSSYVSNQIPDPQLSVIQTCLEEAIDGNIELREENANLLSQLKSCRNCVESDKCDKALQVDSKEFDSHDEETKEVSPVHQSRYYMEPETCDVALQVVSSEFVESPERKSIETAASKNEDVKHICDLLSQCVSLSRDFKVPHKVLDNDTILHSSRGSKSILSSVEEHEE